MGSLCRLFAVASISLAAAPVFAQTLAVDRSSYAVGESTIYSISGAPPNAPIMWSSWRNGESTGEVLVDYGHRTDANGAWSAAAGAWLAAHVGDWIKEARIGAASLRVDMVVRPKPLTEITRRFGIQHWLHTTNRVSDGASRIDLGAAGVTRLGGRAMRTLFTAAEHCKDGNSDGRELLRRAQANDAERAFADPNLHTYMLSAFECLYEGKYPFDPALYADPQKVAMIEGNARELALHLLRTYRGTGKRFILSNWEGDNAVMCSAAYAYAKNDYVEVVDEGAKQFVHYREWCDRIYERIYRGIPNVRAALQGMRLWYEARQRGVNEARAIAASEGIAHVQVLHAPEFNIVRALSEAGLPSSLYDVLPKMSPRPDLVSYSAYETTNALRGATPVEDEPELLAARMRADVATVRSIMGLGMRGRVRTAWPHIANPGDLPVVRQGDVYLGEFGYSRAHGQEPFHARLTETVHATSLELGLLAAFTWDLYDNEWGMFRVDGSREYPIARYYRCRFEAPDMATSCYGLVPRLGIMENDISPNRGQPARTIAP